MKKPRDWSKEGADVIIDHLMPLLQAANRTGDTNDVLRVYGGALGAWWGALMADAGPEFGPQVAELLVKKMTGISLKDKLN